MENTFKNIPFLRLTAALASGIFIASLFQINSTIFTILAAVITICLLVIHKRFNYHLSPLFGLLSIVLLAIIGAVSYSNYNKTKLPGENGSVAATVLETPQEKPNSYKSLLLLHTIQSDDKLEGTNEKLLVYFEKNKAIEQLKPGSQIIFKKSPKPIENNGNPYEFNYKEYLARKHIYRQVYLNTEDWKLAGYKNNTLQTRAETIRDKLLTIYREQEIGERETEILSALTLGYKRELDRETKRVFSSAGAMHVLAVSGLHVGILFFAFSFIFGFLQKRKFGKLIYVFVSIFLLWCYAFITGLSPSVMRACTMFSIIIIASNINRRANIYNTLAASAFLLLLINPNNLFEVGFQLSYMAVFGIVYLQPKLAGLWSVKNKTVLFFWNLITVSVAAQIATFPLSAYYFNQFPTYFLLSNIIVIPAAMVLIPLGIGLLIFSSVPFIAMIISFLIQLVIKSVYFVLSSIESFPLSTQHIVLSKPELLFVLSILFSTFLFLKNREARYIKSTLLFALFFAVSILLSAYNQQKVHEMIVLNSKEPVACFISARNMYVISANQITADDYMWTAIQDIKTQQRIKNTTFLNSADTYRDKYLLLDNNHIVFEGKKVVLENTRSFADQNFSPDIFIAGTSNTQIAKTKADNCYFIQYYPSKKNAALSPNQHILSAQGAFSINW